MMEIKDGEGRVLKCVDGTDLCDARLSFANLRGALLVGEVLDEADLSDACLAGANLEGATCMETIFDRADLRGADLYWCIAHGASFRQANLEGASLQGGTFEGADFTGATLVDADFGLDKPGATGRRPVPCVRAIANSARVSAALQPVAPGTHSTDSPSHACRSPACRFDLPVRRR